jgi:hypothetical protein
VVILLHEDGHRVAYRSGYDGRKSIQKENEADCIAGFETKYVAQSGLLDTGDVEEGISTLSSLLQPTDSVAAFKYQQTDQGHTYSGLFILVVRPGAGALVIDTYTQGSPDDTATAALAQQTLSGLE